MLADFTSHAFAPHIHEALVIAVTEEGGCEFSSRGATGFAAPARVLAFNPGEAHSGHMARSSRWRYRAFYLSQPALRRLCEHLGTTEPPHFGENAIEDRTLSHRLVELHRALCAGEDAEDVLVEQAGILASRHAVCGRPSFPKPARARAALQLVRECYAEPLRLDDLARAANLQPWQLIAAFRAATGLTPHAYLTQVRLHTAARLLRKGSPAAYVAVTCGLSDQSALNRHFKRTFGVTPGQYARAFTT